MTKKKRKQLPPNAKAPLKGAPEVVTPERAQELALSKRRGPKGKSQLIPPHDALDNNHLIRFSAGVYYTTDLHGTTVAKMHKHPLFSKVCIDTLANWSTQDRWVERRRDNMDNWRRTIEAKIGNELVNLMTDMLDGVRESFDKAVKEAMRKGLKAKSFEGAVNAMVRSGEFLMDLQDKIFRTVVPDIVIAPTAVPGALSPAAASSKPRLSVQEARKAASAILEMRRHEMRAEAARAEADKQGKPVDLQVVQGEVDGDATEGTDEAPDGAGQGNDQEGVSVPPVRAEPRGP